MQAKRKFYVSPVRRLALRAVELLAPFRVVVDDGETLATHYAWSYRGALAWAACYSAEWGLVNIQARDISGAWHNAGFRYAGSWLDWENGIVGRIA